MAHGEAFLEAGFEGSPSLPAGWTVTSISGIASWNIQNGGANGNPLSAHNGSNNATLHAPNTNDNKTRLISPTFDTTGFINISLSFWHTQGEWSPNQDDLKVFFSSDGGSGWTELAHYTENVPAWTQRTLAIPGASANSRIAFEGNAKYGYGVCLDEIEVSGIPNTFSVLSVSVTDSDASEVGPDVGTWTISRTGNTSGATSVYYSMGGTAVADSDYTLDSSSPISFAAGETSKVVILTPIDDALGECDEVATLTLLDGTGYAIDAASGDISISDDDRYDRNILVIGSTRSFSDSGESGVVQEEPFNPSSIATHLEGILAQDPLLNETVDVVFEDIYKTKSLAVNYDPTEYNFSSHCYSLAQHYMWPEGKEERLANLRGEGGTVWDTIVLCADPYILANFPGMYAEGVKLIQDEVARGTNPVQIVLLAQWPENSSSFSADDFNEIVYRVGDSAGLIVVPAGKTWDGYTSQDTSAAHPTPKGGYLAAASIYSKLYDRSAKTSGYNFAAGGDAIADHALSVVQANTGVAQYTGAYTSINPFQMKYVTKRVVSFRETGSSTEDRIRAALHRLDDVQRITLSTSGYMGGTRWDFNYGRGNDWWENNKDYEVDPGKYDRSYGFPMHHYPSSAPTTMPYGIDKHYFNGTGYEDGTDLGIAYNMIRPGTRELSLPEDVRAIPIRLMWLKMREISPGLNPLGDNTHMASYLDDATAAFMYTLLSGRCAVVEEPASEGSTEWLQWLGHKIGYETAWQMSHLTTRAPGFQVLPSSTSATTVSPTTTETMTVKFANPPQEDVTVTLSVTSPTAAIVGPETLVFTPSNYNTPQEVTVAGVPGATASEPFEVVFSTSSDDGVYDGISDAWAYTNNRSSTSSVSQINNETIQVTTPQFTSVDINLSVAGADAGNTIFAGPAHGSIAWAGTEDIRYTPDGDYHGSDQIVYAVTLGGNQSIGTIDISVQMPGGDLPDETAPTISILSPADDTPSVTLAANLVVTFDEPVQAGTGNIVLKKSSDDSTIETFDVSSDVLFKGPEMIINPTCELVSTTGYYVIMDNGAVVDDSGNAFAGFSGSTTWNFTTWVGGIAVTHTGTPTVVDNGDTSVTISDWSLNGGNAVILFFAGEYGKDLSATFAGEQMTVIEDSTGGRWVGAIAYITDPTASTGDIAFSWVNDGGKSETIYTPMSLSNVGAAVASSTSDAGTELSFNYTTVVDEGFVVGAAVNNRHDGGPDAAPGFSGNPDTLVFRDNVSGNCAVTLVYGHVPTAGAYTDTLGGDPTAESAAAVAFEAISVNDTTPPTLAGTDIVDDQAGGPVSQDSPITYTVTFSEDMDESTVDASDFSNAGTAPVIVGTATETTPGVFAVQVTPTSAGSLQLQVSAAAVLTDAAGNALDTTAAIADDTIITVDATNVAPVWTSDPVNEIAASEDDAYSSTLADDASDANLDPLTYAKVSGPAWLSVAANGAISGTPTNADVGANAFIVSVSDGTIVTPVEATLNITVFNTNDAPVFTVDPITGADATEDSLYSGTIASSATDVDDGDTLTYAKVSGPAWLAVAADGALSGTPASSDLGPNSFTVQVSDGNGGADTATLNILVANGGAIFVVNTGENTVVDNGATSATIADWTLNGGNAVVVFFAGEQAKSLSATYGGESMVVVEDITGSRHTGAIAYIIDPAVSTGDIALSWLQDSGKSETVHTPISLINVGSAVASGSRDTASTLTLDYTTTVDAGFVVGAAVNNRYDGGPDAAPGFSGNPDTLVFRDNVSGNCAVTLVYGHVPTAGAYTDTLGGDPTAESAAAVAFEAISVNDTTPPTLAGTDIVDDQAGGPVSQDSPITYTVTFSEDMDESTVDASDFSNAGTAPVIVGTATETTPGVFAVQVTPTSAGSLQLQVSAAAVLTDAAGNALDTTAAIADDTIITVDATNVAPVWTSDPVNEIAASEDDAYSSTLADDASDANLDPLTYAKVSGPAWLSVAANGAISGTPTNADVGANAFIVSVSDGTIVTPVEATLNITVFNTNDAPVFTVDPITGADATEDSLYSGTIASSATDVDDGDTLTYAKVSGPAWLAVAADGALSGTPASSDLGPNSFTVQVSDGNGGADTATLNILVANGGAIFVVNTGENTVVDNGATSATIADWTLNGGNAVVVFFAGEQAKSLSATYGGESMVVVEDITGSRHTGAIAYIIDPAVSTGDIALSWLQDSGKSETVHTPISLINVGSAVASGSRDTASTLTLDYTTTVDAGFVVGAAVNNRYDGGPDAAPGFSGNPDTLVFRDNVSGNCAVTLVYGHVPTAGAYTDTLGGDPTAESAAAVAFEAISVNDTTPPTLAGTDIVDDQAGGPVSQDSPITYTVTFSEDMDESTVDASDFSNAGTAPVIVGTATETTPGVFAVQVTPTSAGSLQLQVSAAAVLTDAAGNALDTTAAIADDTIITVDATNVAPVWTSDPVNEIAASEDDAYSSTLADDASDANLDPLTYAKVSGPAWLSVAANGAISGTPTNADVGANAFIVSVSDGTIVTPVEATLNITVFNTNDAPVFTVDPITGADATEDSLYSGTIASSATDVDDGDTLTYAKVSGPAWLAVAADGALSGTPTNADVGANVFTVSGTDDIATPVNATLNITVNAAPSASKLFRTTLSAVGSDSWLTVDVGLSYNSAVVVATPVLPDGTHPPVVTRLRNVSGSSFDIKIERLDGQTGTVAVDLHIIAVEEGVYTLAEHGVTMEAVKYTSTITSGKSNWVAEAQTYQNSYSNPVLVGQVMTSNNANWSAFWCQGSSRTSPPDTSNLATGKHVGEDPNSTRADETIGYIVIESGSGNMDGIHLIAGLGSDILRGVDDSSTGHTYSLSGLSTASAAAVSLGGMDGADGGFAVLRGSTPLSATSITISVDEDTLGDGERKHTSEQAGYLVLE